MNAITLLKNDHKTVEDLFKRFEKLGPRAHKTKRDVADRIVRELSIHAAIEEMVLYPAIREAVDKGDLDSMVLESLEEHHIVKWVLSEIDGMDPAHERFDAKVTVLMENVRDPGVCTASSNIPRSTVNGSDFDGSARTLSFFGACRPAGGRLGRQGGQRVRRRGQAADRRCRRAGLALWCDTR